MFFFHLTLMLSSEWLIQYCIEWLCVYKNTHIDSFFFFFRRSFSFFFFCYFSCLQTLTRMRNRNEFFFLLFYPGNLIFTFVIDILTDNRREYAFISVNPAGSILQTLRRYADKHIFSISKYRWIRPLVIPLSLQNRKKKFLSRGKVKKMLFFFLA